MVIAATSFQLYYFPGELLIHDVNLEIKSVTLFFGLKWAKRCNNHLLFFNLDSVLSFPFTFVTNFHNLEFLLYCLGALFVQELMKYCFICEGN
jgi:hypothetical protein